MSSSVLWNPKIHSINNFTLSATSTNWKLTATYIKSRKSERRHPRQIEWEIRGATFPFESLRAAYTNARALLSIREQVRGMTLLSMLGGQELYGLIFRQHLLSILGWSARSNLIYPIRNTTCAYPASKAEDLEDLT